MGCPRLRWHLHVCSPLMRHWFGQNIYMRQANIVHVHAKFFNLRATWMCDGMTGWTRTHGLTRRTACNEAKCAMTQGGRGPQSPTQRHTHLGTVGVGVGARRGVMGAPNF